VLFLSPNGGPVLVNIPARQKPVFAVIAACPLCHVNLDARQKQIEEKFKETFQISIIYFTQLMGLAFGLKAEILGLDKHFVDPLPALKRGKGIAI